VVVALISFGALAAGCESEGPYRKPSDTFQIHVMQIYGDSTAPDTAKLFGGGMLAHVSDVVDDSAGNVYVLDSQYKKVSVFGSDGRLKRNIVGGLGEGPGEFKMPIALDVADGLVYVYDHALGRISVFDTLGDFKRVIPALNAPYRDILVRLYSRRRCPR
jgi:hypothetical protein